MPLEPADLTVAAVAVAELTAVEGEAWDEAGPGAWSPRRTLDHLVDVMALYAGYVATRAEARIVPPRDGNPAASVEGLGAALVTSAAVLAIVVADLGEQRAFHPSGRADRAGWIGMATTELLVHGHDIAQGLGIADGFVASAALEGLARRTVRRVLPWAPTVGSGWDQLLWATGRLSAPEQPDQGPDWWWHSAPLDEWDGRPRRRTAPPQW